MKNLIHKSGDLFSSTDQSLLHACNTKGVWGSGVAKQFKERFPTGYDIYKKACDKFGDSLEGTSLIIPVEKTIACLFTSKGYGKSVDDPDTIVKNTESSLSELIEKFYKLEIESVSSPKFNSGLFNVPWERTESVLVELLTKHTWLNWTVWSF